MQDANFILSIVVSSLSILGTICFVIFYSADMKHRLKTAEDKIEDLEEKIYNDFDGKLTTISETLIALKKDIEHIKSRPISVDKNDIDSLIKAFIHISENKIPNG